MSTENEFLKKQISASGSHQQSWDQERETLLQMNQKLTSDNNELALVVSHKEFEIKNVNLE